MATLRLLDLFNANSVARQWPPTRCRSGGASWQDGGKSALDTSAGGGNSTAIAEFGIDTHKVDTAGDFVNHVASVMQSEVDRLMANLDDLLGPRNWQGDASRAFENARTQWNASHNNVVAAAQEIADRLKKTGKTWDQADLDNSYNIRKAASGLPYS
jgi:WXG100 family type VII secretion target